jgi:hypothetical protein
VSSGDPRGRARGPVDAGKQDAHRAFRQVGDALSPARGLVAGGAVEPPTIRFQARTLPA